jgi:hypothetical protein
MGACVEHRLQPATETQGQTDMTRTLPDLSNLSRVQLIEALQAAHDKLEAAPKNKVTFKVTDKGCCSVHHGSRFPTSLYRSQWLKILDNADELRAFLTANAARLPLKSD